ncbi:MAG: hypothetical protein RIC55_32800 [Pirellulaceae bacterium]
MIHRLANATFGRVVCRIALWAALWSCVGCETGGTPSGPSADGGQASTDDSLAILRSMVDAYRDAKSYTDEAQVVLSYTQGGRQLQEKLVQSMTFARPNRISFVVEQEAFRATVKCDGVRFVARIIDEATDDMAGQVVVRAAPAELKLRDFSSDPTLYDYINGVLVAPTQLELLLGDDPLPVARGEGVQRKLLDDGAIDGQPCYRIQVDAYAGQPEQGAFVFWIDKQSRILRRLVYPSAQVQANFPPQYRDVKLQVDYVDAAFDVEAPAGKFESKIPPELLQVGYFVVPPPKTPLELDLYATRPGRFEFASDNAGKTTDEDLLGSIAVLLWIDDGPGSIATLSQLARIQRAYAEKPNVAFYVVQEGEAPPVGTDLPILKDTGLYARDVFKLRGYPSLVVLGAGGKVQYAELGPNPDLAATLPHVLDEILAGKDVGAAEAARMKAELALYQQRLMTAKATGSMSVIEIQQAELLPATSPARLTLKRLWTTAEISAPGNILPIQTDDGPRLLVVGAGGEVVELSPTGQIAARRQLDLPPGASIAYVRSNVDKQGRRAFAASARMGPQVHLFDDQWKRTASYPPGEDEQQGVRDVQLADLSDSGKLQALVGFWGFAGVHAVELDGANVWRNRIFPTALSLAVTPPNDVGWRKLLVTGELGEIVELNQFGRHVPPYHVGQIPIQYLYAANYENAQTPYCGISIDAEGKPSAIGLAEGAQQRLVEQWTHSLPSGIMPNQIEWVTSGKLLDDDAGQWLIAGPDGSLHLIGDDSTFSDYWRTGKRLTGMAITRIDGKGALVLATADGVEAWSVEPKNEAP